MCVQVRNTTVETYNGIGNFKAVARTPNITPDWSAHSVNFIQLDTSKAIFV